MSVTKRAGGLGFSLSQIKWLKYRRWCVTVSSCCWCCCCCDYESVVMGENGEFGLSEGCGLGE